MRLRKKIKTLFRKHLLFLLVIVGVIPASPVFADSIQDTAARYKKAERYLGWNKNKLILNSDIQHHWISDQDILWYRHKKPEGKSEVILVFASDGSKQPAFDHQALAKALAKESGQKVKADKLPLKGLRFHSDLTEVTFTAFNKVWRCDTGGKRCVAEANEKVEGIISPDGKWRAFVKDYNIFVASTSGGEPRPLTTDGTMHNAYDGRSEGSLLFITYKRMGVRLPATILWSPDSRYILTHKLDERKVKPLHLLQSTPEDGSFRPQLHTYRYAMAGDEHKPIFSPIIFEIKSGNRVEVDFHQALPASRIYSPQESNYAWWSHDGHHVYFIQYDDNAHGLTLFRVDVNTGKKTALIRETSQGISRVTHFLNEAPVVKVLTNGNILWFSERDGYAHLYLYDGSSGNLIRRVTQGKWVVRDIVHVDESTGWVYFSASGYNPDLNPYLRQLLRTKLDGSETKLLTPEPADHLLRIMPTRKVNTHAQLLGGNVISKNELGFSPSGKYFIDSFSTPNTPSKTVLRKSDGSLVVTITEANVSALVETGHTPVETFKVTAADGVTPIYGNIFRPSDFEEDKSYPIIDAIYPGPQIVTTKYRFDKALVGWDAQAIAELGFIVITVDGRGTPGRSKNFFDYSYGQMEKAGYLEDHMAAIQQLAQRYKYMDVNRVGVYGHSGGGYASTHAMFLYPDFYKVAVSSAGNHDQRGYGFAWGEGYNGDPANTEAFIAASNPPFVKGLKGKLLLIHGEMDDNVHPALTMQVVDALIKENKDFDLLVLPNQAHGFRGKSAAYFKRKRWDYFVQHLLHKTPPAGYKITLPK